MARFLAISKKGWKGKNRWVAEQTGRGEASEVTVAGAAECKECYKGTGRCSRECVILWKLKFQCYSVRPDCQQVSLKPSGNVCFFQSLSSTRSTLVITDFSSFTNWLAWGCIVPLKLLLAYIGRAQKSWYIFHEELIVYQSCLPICIVELL